ncbi:MAG: hypothetical protein K2R93_01975 [Gemmatimonadaceae bacterium]|nr:hypothetical protein [Gemmatimonadaceae bacterium]
MKHPLHPLGRLTLAAMLLASCGGGADSTGPVSTDLACTKTPLTVGVSVTANTATTICRDGNGNSGNFFTLTVTQTTPVTIAMSGNAFPGYLGLFYDGGQVIAQRNPNVPPLSIAVVLGPGTYTVIGGSMTGADGPYSIVASPLTLNACVANLMATEGAIVTGTVTANGCVDEGGNRTQAVTWGTRTAKTLAFTVTLDKKAAVLFNGGAPNIITSGGPGNVTGSMPTQALLSYHMATAYVTHVAAFSTLPISYTIKAE